MTEVRLPIRPGSRQRLREGRAARRRLGRRRGRRRALAGRRDDRRGRARLTAVGAHEVARTRARAGRCRAGARRGGCSPRRPRSPPRTARRRRPARARGLQAAPGRGSSTRAPSCAPPSAPGRAERGGDMQVTMTVNGEERSEEVEPRLLLVHFLRDTLGLTGTHWGCDTSNCGACAVLMDGEPGQVVHRARGDGRRARGRAPSRGWSRAASSTRSSRASWRSTACSAASARRG